MISDKSCLPNSNCLRDRLRWHYKKAFVTAFPTSSLIWFQQRHMLAAALEAQFYGTSRRTLVSWSCGYPDLDPNFETRFRLALSGFIHVLLLFQFEIVWKTLTDVMNVIPRSYLWTAETYFSYVTDKLWVLSLASVKLTKLPYFYHLV